MGRKEDICKRLLSLYRFLENEIHKTNLKLMEGDTIKKKYVSILDMLKQERLGFANQLENLEANIFHNKTTTFKVVVEKKGNSHMISALSSMQFLVVSVSNFFVIYHPLQIQLYVNFTFQF
jgi:hypothetical protein